MGAGQVYSEMRRQTTRSFMAVLVWTYSVAYVIYGMAAYVPRELVSLPSNTCLTVVLSLLNMRGVVARLSQILVDGCWRVSCWRVTVTGTGVGRLAGYVMFGSTVGGNVLSAFTDHSDSVIGVVRDQDTCTATPTDSVPPPIAVPRTLDGRVGSGGESRTCGPTMSTPRRDAYCLCRRTMCLAPSTTSFCR